MPTQLTVLMLYVAWTPPLSQCLAAKSSPGFCGYSPTCASTSFLWAYPDSLSFLLTHWHCLFECFWWLTHRSQAKCCRERNLGIVCPLQGISIHYFLWKRSRHLGQENDFSPTYLDLVPLGSLSFEKLVEDWLSSPQPAQPMTFLIKIFILSLILT